MEVDKHMWRSIESLLKFLGALFAFSITLHAEQLLLQTYTTAEGLPHNEINRIVKDSRGFLWFCTAESCRVLTVTLLKPLVRTTDYRMAILQIFWKVAAESYG